MRIDLHPSKNNGEKVSATVSFENRAMIMSLDAYCYGSHNTSMIIVFDSPSQMLELAEALRETAVTAQIYFENHP